MAKNNSQKTDIDLSSSGIFSHIDLHFARFIEDFSDNRDPHVFLAAALTSRASSAGDICLDLESISDAELSEETSPPGSTVTPKLNIWRRSLMAHPAIGRPGDRLPLILDNDNRLYLFRYWQYETDLLSSIRGRIQGQLTDFDPAKARSSLNRLFRADEGEVDWQKIAAVIGLLKRFCVITGGPGTGKTYAIAGILALLQECTGRNKSVVRLTAPTGKAAARLAESLLQAKQNLNCSPAVKDSIPNEVFTIHRLLQPVAGTPYFRYNSSNILPADVVVVDEASMVDLALMTKLLQAVPADARLLIAGDKDQLASVEAGSVLGDICDRQTNHGFSRDFLEQILTLTGLSEEHFSRLSATATSLQDCICVLQKNYRFSSRSNIAAISHAINRGDIENAMKLLKNASETAVEWQEVSTPKELRRKLVSPILEGYRKYLTIKDPVLAMKAFNRFKILCALKIGPYGAQALNLLAEQILTRENLITGIAGPGLQWYRGRPVMITRNSYSLGLYNGDIGIALPDPESPDNQLMVYFQDASGGVRRFLPQRLPEHQTVYAMTVHKSQGSEFNHVLLILPDKAYPLMTRELIYTGLTRARQKITIWGREPVIRTAISRRIDRSSGLREGLWNRKVQGSGFKVQG